MLKTSDFYYELPKELIAQTPLDDRAGSRMLVMERGSGAVRHEAFRGITSYLRAGDCLVVNDTRVYPARLLGERENGGAAEVLLLERKTANEWDALVKPGRRLRVGAVVRFGGGVLTAVIGEERGDGVRAVTFRYDGIFEELLDKLGETPLPPYITAKLADRERYQTVYAKESGSAAAPTAGLHFTEDVLAEIRDKGVTVRAVTLHVGLGTFRPVKVDDASAHKMHEEYFTVSGETAAAVNETKERGGRVIAVGTTSLRALESAAEGGKVKAISGKTGIFIYPPYEFKVVDGLLTNFHLPESTLIMLVSALAGRERVLAAYNAAVRERYRFFSFGDAMLIL